MLKVINYTVRMTIFWASVMCKHDEHADMDKDKDKGLK